MTNRTPSPTVGASALTFTLDTALAASQPAVIITRREVDLASCGYRKAQPGDVLVGAKVVVHSRGGWRPVFVEKVGPKRAAIAYTTEAAIKTAQDVYAICVTRLAGGLDAERHRRAVEGFRAGTADWQRGTYLGHDTTSWKAQYDPFHGHYSDDVVENEAAFVAEYVALFDAGVERDRATVAAGPVNPGITRKSVSLDAVYVLDLPAIVAGCEHPRADYVALIEEHGPHALPGPADSHCYIDEQPRIARDALCSPRGVADVAEYNTRCVREVRAERAVERIIGAVGTIARLVFEHGATPETAGHVAWTFDGTGLDLTVWGRTEPVSRTSEGALAAARWSACDGLAGSLAALHGSTLPYQFDEVGREVRVRYAVMAAYANTSADREADPPSWRRTGAGILWDAADDHYTSGAEGR